jgi:hypothetical protein
MPGHQVTFRGWNCRVVRGSYGHSERIALSLYDLTDGEPVATASVNLPEIVLGPDEVIIKDYSENEGMLDTLILAGVISLPLRVIQLQYVEVYVCACLI